MLEDIRNKVVREMGGPLNCMRRKRKSGLIRRSSHILKRLRAVVARLRPAGNRTSRNGREAGTDLCLLRIVGFCSEEMLAVDETGEIPACQFIRKCLRLTAFS